MGRELYCDFCRISVPIEENLQKIEIGGSKTAEVCLTDAQKLITAVKVQIAEAAKQMTAATPAAKAEVPGAVPPMQTTAELNPEIVKTPPASPGVAAIPIADLPATAKPSEPVSREGPAEPAK